MQKSQRSAGRAANDTESASSRTPCTNEFRKRLEMEGGSEPRL